MPKLIPILIGLLVLVSSCRKDPIVQQDPPGPVHFLDPFMGDYQGTMNYFEFSEQYSMGWDLNCDYNFVWITDTTYQESVSLNVMRDSGMYVTVDDALDEADRSFELDSNLSYQTYISANPVSKIYYFNFVPNKDSLYIIIDQDGWSQQNCLDYEVVLTYSLKKVN
ncbi:MAG: hypothetical protein HUJ25_05740 [Crocinitomicaceae bacterium]|nr:hypothetical protein [Crocinitomicaceae bacterium]